MHAARTGSLAFGWSRALAWLQRCDRRAVLLILLFALSVRGVSLARNDLIGTDSMRFLHAAQKIERGELEAALADPYHPGLPGLTAAINRAQTAILGAPGGFEEDRVRRERAAYLVVLSLGLAIVALQIALARRLFPEAPPGLVGLLAACQPYLVRSSVDVMSDTPMLAGLLLAFLAGAASLRHLAAALVCGLSIGLAYLARPEGLVAGPAVLGFWWLRDRREPVRFAARAVLLLASLTVVALPYATAISKASGRPTLTLKKDVYQMIGIEGRADPASEKSSGLEPRPAPSRPQLASAMPLEGWALVLGSVAMIFEGWFDTAPEVLGLAFLAGLALLIRDGPRREGHLLYGLCALVTVAVLTLLLVGEGDPDYLSRRHVFVLVALSLPLAARGLLGIGGWLGGRFPKLGAERATALVVGATLLGLTLHATSTHRDNQRAQITSARRILAEHGPEEVVFTDREKVAYYAGATLRSLPRDTATLARQLREVPRAWVAFYHEGEACCGPLAATLDGWDGIGLVWRIEEPNATRTLLVYRSERAEAAPPAQPR